MTSEIGYADGSRDEGVGEGLGAQDTGLQSHLDRVLEYLKSDVLLHSLYLVRELSENARQIGYQETCTHLLPVLAQFSRDDRIVIRQTLGEQLPLFAEYLSGAEGGYEKILQFILPVFHALLVDESDKVREQVDASLPKLALLLKPEDFENHLFPLVSHLALDTSEEEHRVSAAEHLNELAPIIGASNVERFVLPHVVILGGDDMFRVRKAVASNLNNIASQLGTSGCTEKLLPLFLKLGKDDIWGVRKACADSLVAISASVLPGNRLNDLVPMFTGWVEDTSRWVRSACFQALGPFIATFSSEGESVPDFLLEKYKSMAVFNPTTSFGDSDYVQYCAFNFPAVLLTVGADRWTDLQSTFYTLSSDAQWKVRKTLSYSLHEVAKLLGEKVTEEQLLSTFELFLRDLSDVKIGVITHFSQILKVLSPEKRKQYFSVLEEIQHAPGSWRLRLLISQQLGDLATFFDAETVQAELVPFVHALLDDPVASVRKSPLSGLSNIAKALVPLPEKRIEFLTNLKSLYTQTEFQKRLIFTKVCLALAGELEEDEYEDYFLTPLFTLVNDAVPNIRFSVAKVLIELAQKDSFKEDSRFADAVAKLKADGDRDVVIFAGGEPPLKRQAGADVAAPLASAATTDPADDTATDSTDEGTSSPDPSLVDLGDTSSDTSEDDEPTTDMMSSSEAEEMSEVSGEGFGEESGVANENEREKEAEKEKGEGEGEGDVEGEEKGKGEGEVEGPTGSTEAEVASV
eukprot:TRINITY_DN640_c0_g2_i1.p1 TRINITY_DN640_c0_g2~~TRINITY_DN640_c0_g2_i1.p1  ORF type:complete len:840 (-),score=221.90 TRINITY_DN640_c0_g2_i1:103-2340(-)